MAKAVLNPSLRQLSGSVGGLVFKQYRRGLVVTRHPRMEGIKPSPAQLAQRDRFREAALFHRTVLSDPALRKRYAAVARKKGLSLPAVTMAEFMKRRRANPDNSEATVKNAKRPSAAEPQPNQDLGFSTTDYGLNG